jgi:pimeloyl-ACP methyl ester carboxylesterase
LPDDFSERHDRFDLASGDRVRVSVTAATDVFLRTLGACVAGTLAFPLGYHPGRITNAKRSHELYMKLALSGDAHRFLRRPPRGIRVHALPASRTLFRPKDGICEDLQFESPFVPYDVEQRREYLRHANNRIAHARYWHHKSGRRPTVLAIHGFSADLYHLNEWFFALPWLYRLGCDVMLVTLPFHGKRQTRFSPFSGHGFFAGGAPRLNEAFAQAVLDFRIFVDWLEDRGVHDVGLTGVSLGGFTASLIATVEDRLRFVIPNTPVVSIADLVMEWEPIGAAVRLSLAAAKSSLREARELLAVSSPLTYPAVVPRERRMIIGGVGDRLAPPKHALLLWEHWERCALHWFPGSHLIHLDRGAYLRQMRTFLQDIHFLV